MDSRLRNEIFELFADLLIPSAVIFRTIKLQPELDRFENDAEHSYMLAVFGCALADRASLKLDVGKVSHYALVHDLVEVFAGDTTIWAPQEVQVTKVAREADALKVIRNRFASFSWIGETIEAYEQLTDQESCYVYALDKILPYIVMAAVNHQPFPPSLKAYEEKMSLARDKVARYPRLLDLFDSIDEDYRKRPHFISGPA
jgi:5'-deoxynucleotidase YfbR-like HD superfamily hydrolase